MQTRGATEFAALATSMVVIVGGCGIDPSSESGIHAVADLEQERQALLAVYESGKRAHVESDVAALLEHTADEFITVSNGQIFRQSRSDSRNGDASANVSRGRP